MRQSKYVFWIKTTPGSKCNFSSSKVQGGSARECYIDGDEGDMIFMSLGGTFINFVFSQFEVK